MISKAWYLIKKAFWGYVRWNRKYTYYQLAPYDCRHYQIVEPIRELEAEDSQNYKKLSLSKEV
ncbi:hypothetical protein [Cysteiniphilum sp. 6C5]|uniref:hypothetical protein n=1 Tax=unclassified Cysteiniphilum TaxID=2610889 RepID=UPI003F82CB89